MKEIKLRAYSPVNKEMYYANHEYHFILYESSIMYVPNSFPRDSDLTSFDTDAYEDTPEFIKVSQFTGLKDKNERDIYEGNVVTAFFAKEEKPREGIVEIGGGWMALNMGKSYYETDDCTPLYLLRDFEVIGNIFEGEFAK